MFVVIRWTKINLATTGKTDDGFVASGLISSYTCIKVEKCG